MFVLQQMGYSNAAITAKLAEVTGQSKAAVREVLQGSVMTSFSNDKAVLVKYFNGDFSPLNNPTIAPVMDAEWQKTCGELENLTRTTMSQYNMDVVNLLNEAEIQVATGMNSYSAAVCDVLDRYASKGLVIDYPTGARRSLEAAVRCCVVTSMNQTAAQVTNKYIAEGGIEYVLVSAHEGARHSDKGGLFSHDGWQGKAYKIRGSEAGYPNLLESTGYDIDPSTGEGQVVNTAGLHGYNCRHSHSPWDKGLENPWLDENGKPRVNPQASREKYENEQTQRGMERSIRKTKRQLNMKQSELDLLPEGSIERGKAQAEYDRLAYKLRQKNMKYGEFCADHNLTQQADRVKVAGWNAAESRKANGRATKVENMVRLKEFLKLGSNNVYVNRMDKLYANARKITPIDGFQDIVVHGDPYGFTFKNADGKEENVSAKEFLGILRKNKEYKGGPIRLISCQTGADGGIVPKYLAKELNVDVIAPNEIVNVDSDGKMILANDDLDATMGIETGKWLKFSPSGEVEEWSL